MPDGDNKKTIMVVDDELEIRESIDWTLTRAGFEVVLAESGPDCIQKLDSVTPDLILLDIFMDPWDGWKTLGEIKNIPGTYDIPITMLTVVPLTIEDFENTPIEHSKFVNVEDYLVKPVNRENLLRAVSDIIGLNECLRNKVNNLIQNGEEKAAKDFEKAARNLSRNIKLKQSLFMCLIRGGEGDDRVRRILEDLDRNIQLSRFKLREMEGHFCQ